MISLDPNERPSFDTLLHTSRGTLFPESFYSFLHNYVVSINEIPANFPFNNPVTPSIAANSTVKLTSAPSISAARSESKLDMLPSASDHRLERIWADYESVELYIFQELPQESPEMGVKIEHNSLAPLAKSFQVCFVPILISCMSVTSLFLKDIFPIELYMPNRDSKLHTLLGGRRATLEGE